MTFDTSTTKYRKTDTIQQISRSSDRAMMLQTKAVKKHGVRSTESVTKVDQNPDAHTAGSNFCHSYVSPASASDMPAVKPENTTARACT
eukprot:236051-Pleurochrysis_carterae.AAC.1